MRITNNLSALTAFNALKSTNKSMDSAIRSLSTGLRINSASDDSAGFAVSEKMRSQISGLDIARRNSQDGMSLLQTAEGALGETNSMLQRMRELAVQAANDSLTSQDRQYIQLEVDQLKDQIDRIAETTQFNRKRILDGSSGALWSSGDLGVTARIKGGLTHIDQFGQKISSEGNYRLEVTAEPGQAQVQKSSIITMSSRGAKSAVTANVVFVLDVSGSMGSEIDKVKQHIASFKKGIEAKGVETVNIGICTYGSGSSIDPNFVACTYPDGSLWSSDTAQIKALLDPITAPYPNDTYNYYAVQKAAEIYGPTYGGNRYMVLVTDIDHSKYFPSDWPPPDAPTHYTKETVMAALQCEPSTDTDDIHLSVVVPSPDSSSEFYDLVDDPEKNMFQSDSDWSGKLIELGAAIGDEVVKGGILQLGSISQFYNSAGVSLVEHPAEITITQGDGQTASITLYSTDTMQDVADKINDVIANSFGNARYTDNPSKFCTLADGTENTSESVYSREPVYGEGGEITGYEIRTTMLVRSALPGKAGELYFSGDEDLLRALGLNTIQESSETSYTASLYNAHSGKPIVSAVKTTGNVLADAVYNVDVEFDPMAGLKSEWDEDTKRYIVSSNGKYTALFHLKDNGITFQTGSNMGEDFIIQLGDASCDSLGIVGVNVVTRETASRAISTIDTAIKRVSSQRAKVGAYQNALEHMMSNLTTSSTNLTSAESRLRDTDMAATMMEFVKLQILNQSGTSMLAQANQLPQSVLSMMQ